MMGKWKTFDRFPNLKFHSAEQGTPEWLAARLTVGCSEAKDAFAKGQGKTRNKKMDEKLYHYHTGKPVPTIETYDMRRGKEKEPEARVELERIIGRKIHTSGLIINVNYPGFHLSTDGLTFEDEGLGVSEIKVPKPTTHLKWQVELYKNKGRLCPNEHKVQVDMAMIIADAAYGIFFSYCPVSDVPSGLLDELDGEWEPTICNIIPKPSVTDLQSYQSKMKAWNEEWEKNLPKAEKKTNDYLKKQEDDRLVKLKAISTAKARTEDLIRRIQQ